MCLQLIRSLRMTGFELRLRRYSRKMSKTSSRYRTLIYLLSWVSISVVASVVGAGVVFLLISSSEAIINLAFSLSIPWYALTLAGALVYGFVLRRIVRGVRDEGVSSYIAGVTTQDGHFTLRQTLAKLVGAVVSLGTLANVGLIAPAGRISAGVVSRIVSAWLHISGGKGRDTNAGSAIRYTRTAAIAGMASAAGIVAGAPIAGGIFAVEILEKANMRYSDLFPAILASATASFLSRYIGRPGLFSFDVPDARWSISLIGAVALTAVLAGLAGRLYGEIYRRTHALARRVRYPALMLFAASAVSVLLAVVTVPGIIGRSEGLGDALIAGNLEVLSIAWAPWMPIVVIALLAAVAKATANSITVATGMSGGFTGPTIVVGVLLAVAVQSVLGLSFRDPEGVAVGVAGVAGMLASSANVPITAIVLVTERFGVSYGVAGAMGAIIGFQINRHHMLYEQARDHAAED